MPHWLAERHRQILRRQRHRDGIELVDTGIWLPGEGAADGILQRQRLAARLAEAMVLKSPFSMRRGGNMGDRLRRILAVSRALKSAEEEQLVFDDLAAGGPAVLVSLQRVVRRREEIARVQIAVADVFEQIAMECIRSGLGDHVDGRARMRAEARRHRAGLDAEFLQRVRERERHVDVRHRVGGVAAVQKIGRAVALSAGHRDAGRIPEGLAAGVAAIARKPPRPG